MELIIGIIGSLISASIAGTVSYMWRGNLYEKRVDEAPKKYVNYLGELIKKAEVAVKNSYTQDDIIVAARSIVSTRDDLRKHMITIASVMNSEIDRLSDELGNGSDILVPRQNYERKNKIDIDELKRTIRVLAEKWPIKEVQIENEIRKIITELGLEKA
jgi:hypothetical protein